MYNYNCWLLYILHSRNIGNSIMLAMSVVDGVSNQGQVKPDFIIINTEKKHDIFELYLVCKTKQPVMQMEIFMNI